MLVAVLTALIFPLFFVRKGLKQEKLSLIWGSLQDLFVILQPLGVLWGVQGALGLRGAWSLVGLGFLYFLIYFITFLDALVFRETALRVDSSIVWMVKDVGRFWDSGKARGVLRILGPFALLPTYLVCTLLLFPGSVQSFGSLFGVVLVLSGGAAGISYLFYSKEDLYRFENPVLRLERDLFYRVLKSIFRKRSVVNVSALAPANEAFRYVNANAPLLKFTEGFFGKKQCDVACKRGEKPHVIFLFLESFRAQELAVFGSKRGLTPRFDRLAKEGICFKNFYANGLPSFQAVVASLFGIPTVMEGKSSLLKGEMPLISLAEVLRQHGYVTTYGVGGPLQFDKQREFYTRNGFDTVLGRSEILAAYPQAEMTSWGVHDEYFYRYVVDFLEKNRELPQFLSLFSLSNHEPWMPPDAFKVPQLPEGISESYARFLTTVHYTDHCVGLFVDLLKERNLSRDVILFALGDHGFPMGEHGNNFILQRNLYEENIHVPLVIYAEGRIANPREIGCICSQTDLFATVMDVLQLNGVNHSVGTSLLRESEEREAFFYNPYVYKYSGIRKGDYKLIHTKLTERVELYNVQEDPEEREDLSEVKPDETAHLLQRAAVYEELFSSLSQNNAFVPGAAQRASEGGVFLNLSYQLTLSDEMLDATSKRFPKLQELNLSNCSTITDRGVLHFLERCPELLSINLSHCVALSEEILGAVFKKARGLEELRLEGVPLQGNPFHTIKQRAQSLRLLHLKRSALLEDSGMQDVVALCPHLQEVSLSCANLTKEGLAHLLKSWTLKLLVLEEGGHISANDFESALDGARGLEGLSLIDFNLSDRFLTVVKERSIQVLALDYSHALTDAGLKNLYGAPIKHLNLGYPEKVTLNGVRALQDSLPFLRTLYYQGALLCENSHLP